MLCRAYSVGLIVMHFCDGRSLVDHEELFYELERPVYYYYYYYYYYYQSSTFV